jgi:hypothetical protein
LERAVNAVIGQNTPNFDVIDSTVTIFDAGGVRSVVKSPGSPEWPAGVQLRARGSLSFPPPTEAQAGVNPLYLDVTSTGLDGAIVLRTVKVNWNVVHFISSSMVDFGIMSRFGADLTAAIPGGLGLRGPLSWAFDAAQRSDYRNDWTLSADGLLSLSQWRRTGTLVARVTDASPGTPRTIFGAVEVNLANDLNPQGDGSFSPVAGQATPSSVNMRNWWNESTRTQKWTVIGASGLNPDWFSVDEDNFLVGALPDSAPKNQSLVYMKQRYADLAPADAPVGYVPRTWERALRMYVNVSGTSSAASLQYSSITDGSTTSVVQTRYARYLPSRTAPRGMGRVKR